MGSLLPFNQLKIELWNIRQLVGDRAGSLRETAVCPASYSSLDFLHWQIGRSPGTQTAVQRLGLFVAEFFGDAQRTIGARA